MTDSRKPLAPDRPGRYECRDGDIVTIGGKTLQGLWIVVDAGYNAVCLYYPNGTGEAEQFDIIARAPDDAAWCLAQARLLCPEGYAGVPVEPPVEVLAAASYPQAAFIFYREIIACARNSKWIATAASASCA